jgi:hypothetical protein
MDQAFLSLTAFAVFSFILLFICFELIYFNIAVLFSFIQKKYSYILLSLFLTEDKTKNLIVVGNTNIEKIKRYGYVNFIYQNMIKVIPNRFFKKNITVITFVGLKSRKKNITIREYLDGRFSKDHIPVPNATLIMLSNISESQRQECDEFVNWVTQVYSLELFDIMDQNKILDFILDLYFFGINMDSIYKLERMMKPKMLFINWRQVLKDFPLPTLRLERQFGTSASKAVLLAKALSSEMMEDTLKKLCREYKMEEEKRENREKKIK